MVWLSIFFLVLAGIAKGYLDAIADKGVKTDEWRNKYDFTRNKNHWWYFGLYKPRYSEKFPFSSTLLVALTDKWHRAQLIMLRFMYLAVAVALTQNLFGIILLSFVVFPIVVGMPFEIIYTKNKKK
jgi:hypothetical protein